MEQLISFPDQSQSFTNGVEFGRLLNKMEQGLDPIENNKFPVRIENQQVISDACRSYGYVPLFGKEHFGEWVDFIGVKKTASSN